MTHPNGMKIWEHVSRLVFLVLTCFIGVMAFEGRQIIVRVNQNDRRITAIEANRYTSADALNDSRQSARAIAELRAWIETHYPPEWLRDDVTDLRKRMDQLSEDLRRHMLQTNDMRHFPQTLPADSSGRDNGDRLKSSG